MKRMLALLLTLLLLPSAALMEEKTPLSESELTAWSESLLSAALKDGGYTAEANENGCALLCEGYTLYLDSDAPASDSGVLEVLIDRMDSDSAWQCPRGLSPTNSLSALLKAYPNDNEALAGSAGEAVLYIKGSLADYAAAGFILREGQRVTVVEHCLYTRTGTGVEKQGIVYSLENNDIIAIRMYAKYTLSPQEAQSEINALSILQETDDCFAYESFGASALTREDMTFAGMDLLDETPEDAVMALGDCDSDEWLEDKAAGQWMRVMQWTDAKITFLYDANKQFLRADSIGIDGADMDGPRGLRAGDTLDTALSRFLNNSSAQSGESILLYGDGVTPPYGIADYYAGGATVRYTIEEKGVPLMLTLTFENGRLVCMTGLYY